MYKANGNNLSIKQKRFLIAYKDTLNISEAAKISGMRIDAASAALKRKTLFSDTFRKIQNEVISDPRFTKAGVIGEMKALMIEAKESGDFKLALDILKEINKMVDGNLAVQKSITENKQQINVAVIDMTKPMEIQEHIETEDTDYIEVGDDDE